MVRGSASAEPGSSDDAGYARALSTGGIGSAPTVGTGTCSRRRGPRPPQVEGGRTERPAVAGVARPVEPEGAGAEIDQDAAPRAQYGSQCQAMPLPRYAGGAAATGGCAPWPTGRVRRDSCVSRTRRELFSRRGTFPTASTSCGTRSRRPTPVRCSWSAPASSARSTCQWIKERGSIAVDVGSIFERAIAKMCALAYRRRALGRACVPNSSGASLGMLTVIEAHPPAL